jgi:catalase
LTGTAWNNLTSLRQFLESILGGPPAIGKFLSTHPTVGRFLGIPKPTPESYGTEAYYAVSAFQFNAPDGSKRFGRYTILPKAGVKHLTPEEASGRSPSFLLDEIVERVSNGPVEFELWLQLANEGDQTDDATVQWPEDRERVLLGTVKLDAIVPDGAQKMQYIIYDPIPRVEGIEATEDPLFEVRAAVYLISGRKRRAAPELKA